MNHLFLYFCSFMHCLMNNYQKYRSWIQTGSRFSLLFVLMLGTIYFKPNKNKKKQKKSRFN